MSNIYRFLIVAFLFQTGTFLQSYSNPEKDTAKLSSSELISDSHTNLDSMIHLWYMKHNLKIVPDTTSGNKTDYPNNIPDSVYIERLQRIPSIVDLSYNNIVKNYIKVYTEKRRENVEFMLAASNYYFPLFEEILNSYNLPTELKYLTIIESALNPRAVSRVGATGIWQFMYGTGRMYDLLINSYVDERRDPIKSTHAAALFITDLYEMFHDWTLVIAAYNCGPGNVSKAIRRTGGSRDFWDLYYYLPRETRGYVPAYIAATYTMHYYKEHELSPAIMEFNLATDTVIVRDDLHLKQVSEVLDIPLKELRDLNPQYKIDVIPAKGKAMSLTLPVLKTGDFISLEDSIYNFKDSLYFNADNTIKNPYKSSFVYQPPSNKTKITYTVKSGDNLGYISEWFHVRISDLRYWNRIRGNMIMTGQKLVIYVPKNKVAYYERLNNASFAEKQASIGKSATRDEIKNEPLDNDFIYYKVKSGDTLWEIAKKYSGVTENDIKKLNNIQNARLIKTGQMLKIKKKS